MRPAHAPFIAAASPELFQNAALVGAASGLATGIYQLFKARIDAKNGRKLKLKVGDIEVEATQMKGAEVFWYGLLATELREKASLTYTCHWYIRPITGRNASC